MSFAEFLEANRHWLLGHYLLSKHAQSGFTLPEPWPPESLTEEEEESLLNALDACIPHTTWITDLRNWDIHFEREMDPDWYFSVVFGSDDDVVSCAEQLADFFLEQVNQYDMDYDQHDDPDRFEELVINEAMSFITQWRNNVWERYRDPSNAMQPTPAP